MLFLLATPISPLFGEKADVRWVVKPLKVLHSEDIFAYPTELPLPEQCVTNGEDYSDQLWLG